MTLSFSRHSFEMIGGHFGLRIEPGQKLLVEIGGRNS